MGEKIMGNGCRSQKTPNREPQIDHPDVPENMVGLAQLVALRFKVLCAWLPNPEAKVRRSFGRLFRPARASQLLKRLPLHLHVVVAGPRSRVPGTGDFRRGLSHASCKRIKKWTKKRRKNNKEKQIKRIGMRIALQERYVTPSPKEQKEEVQVS